MKNIAIGTVVECNNTLAVVNNVFELPNNDYVYDLRKLNKKINVIHGAKGKIGTKNRNEFNVLNQDIFMNMISPYTYEKI